MKRIFPASFYNTLSLAGTVIAAVSLGIFFFLFLLEATAEHSSPYVGILAFVIVPVFFVLGAALIIFGIWREHRMERLGRPHGLNLPKIDLNNPHHRTALTFSVIGALVLLGFITFTSFKGYEYTESDQFCGETCHTAMEPEYTAYQFSPHARVGCVQCHIGSGASYFMKSKLSGSYQVYAAIFNKFPRPIPTPINNLRPAQQTCEQCHWPKQFFSEKLRANTYYISDETNTKWTIDLLMKVGGGNIEAGPTSGIHWHMNIANEVTYAAADSQRQSIPWVKIKGPDGKVEVYRSTENPVSDEDLKKMETRRMDCIDCHNRPTHIYHPGARSVNHVMSLGWIDPKLPNVKSTAVTALEGAYSTKKTAQDSIRLVIEEYYQTNYPDIARTKKSEIDRTVAEVQKIYSRSYFPEMRVSWEKYPDNLGHMYYPGCFRCHDGKHVSESGKTLSRDCNTCHTILAQQFEKDTLRMSLGGIEYKHPVDIGDAWKEMNCSDCHNQK